MIDVTDFTARPYKVPNQNESHEFADFIADKEAELAGRYLLGWELWEEFKAALEGSGALEDRFEKLRDGEYYTYNGVQYKYSGWVDLVRPGIYADWIPKIAEKQTNVGVVRNSPVQQATLEEDQYPFSVGPWNEFVKKAGCSQINSFYGWMKSREDEFDNWEYCQPPRRNRWDV